MKQLVIYPPPPGGGRERGVYIAEGAPYEGAPRFPTHQKN